jgi:hypothetical protein
VGYQVSRRASAMLADLGLPAHAVYKFVDVAYQTRSDIVHGGTPVSKNLAGERCPIDQQASELDRLIAAMFKQVLSSSSTDRPAYFADERISEALDSQRANLTTGEPVTRRRMSPFPDMPNGGCFSEAHGWTPMACPL